MADDYFDTAEQERVILCHALKASRTGFTEEQMLEIVKWTRFAVLKAIQLELALEGTIRAFFRESGELAFRHRDYCDVLAED